MRLRGGRHRSRLHVPGLPQFARRTCARSRQGDHLRSRRSGVSIQGVRVRLLELVPATVTHLSPWPPVAWVPPWPGRAAPNGRDLYDQRWIYECAAASAFGGYVHQPSGGAGLMPDRPSRSPKDQLRRRVAGGAPPWSSLRGDYPAELQRKGVESRRGFEPVSSTVPCPATTSDVGSIAQSASANERLAKLLFAAARQAGNQNGHQRT
jgi:hypothetical protein